MLRFIIAFSWELFKAFLRACWVRLEEIWSGEVSLQSSVDSRQTTARFRIGAGARYVDTRGKRHAAIIVAVGPDLVLGQCALIAVGVGRVDTAFFDPDTKALGTWHWGDGGRSLQ
jgi:hypothetical protein